MMKSLLTAILLISACVTATAQGADRLPGIQHLWGMMGVCSYTDDLLPALMPNFTPTAYPVDIEADDAIIGYYRIVNPYGEGTPDYDLLRAVDYATDGDHYIVINARNPENVIIEPSTIGVTTEFGELIVYSYSWLASKGDPMITEEYVTKNGLRGTLKDGQIIFPTPGSLWITTAELDKNEMGYTTNLSGKFSIQLPEAKDYSIEIVMDSWCTDSKHKITVSTACGADVATVRIIACTDPADEAAVSKALANATPLAPAQETVPSMSRTIGSRQKVYLVAAAYDKSGNEQRRAVHHCYTPDTSADWETLAAKAVLTEDIVAAIFPQIDVMSLEIEVQRNKTCPTRFRLKNPYLEHPQNSMDASHGHDHYLYLDITDPDCVVLEEAPMGMATDAGHMVVSSLAGEMLAKGNTINDVKERMVGGVMRNGIITFPNPDEVRVAFHTDRFANWYRTNYSVDANNNVRAGSLSIDLTAASVIDIQSNPVVTIYYNLQGIKTDSPIPGNIYILRQGSKATKIRF